MASPRSARGREKTGHADSPRQDTQRPTHADRGDAGGQESTNRRQRTTQIPKDTPPPRGATPPPGELHRDPPLPRGGRQPERPGQHGRSEDRLGARDVETLDSNATEGFGGESDRRAARGDALRRDNAATRRSSRSSTSTRRDRAVGAEEPPPRRRRS